MTRIITPPYITSTPSLTGRLHCDEKELLEPNLLIPGKLPIGPVVIDSSHRLASNLHFSCFFDSLSPRDLVTSKALTKSGSPTIGATEKGRHVEFDKANPDYYTLQTAANWSGSNVVAEVIIRIDTHDTDGSMAVSWNDNGTYYNQLGVQAKLYSFNQNLSFVSTNPDDGFWHHYFMGGFTDIATYQRVFVDGKDDTFNTTLAKPSVPLGAKTLYFAKYPGGTTWDLDGGIRLIRLWKDISSVDVKELTADPMQIYKAA